MSDVTAPGPTVDAPRYRSRRRFWLKAALLALVLLFGVPGFMFWRVHRAEVRRVEAMLESIRQRGEPTTPEELTAFYRAGLDDHDSTGAWLDAFALEGGMAGFDDLKLPVISQEGGELPDPGEPWPERPAIKALLAQNAEFMAKIEAAVAAGGEARFPLRFADGWDMLLPHVQPSRKCCQLLSAAALLDIHAGDGVGTARRIDQLLATAELLDHEPLLVSLLVRLACESITLSVVREASAAGVLSADDTRTLLARISKRDYEPALLRALLGERALDIHTHRQVAMGAFKFGRRNPVAPGFLRRTIQHHDLTLTLEFFDKLLAAAKLTGPERLTACQTLDSEFNALQAAATPFEDKKFALTFLLMPAQYAVIRAIERLNATRDATCTILALDLYRRQHGRLPGNLAELVPDFLPDVPIDPFDGQPLRYRVESDEALVWTIGSDQIDDGGVQNPGTAEPDIVFRLRAAPAAAAQP